jgi:hypothetical protein
MGILAQVKKAARQTKLQGEILLVERELESLQKKAGAELFTVLYDWEQQQLHLQYDNANANAQKPEQALPVGGGGGADDASNETLELPVPALTIVYRAAREDIMEMVQQRQHKVEEVDVVEVKLENVVPATSARTKAQNASQWMSHTASLTKLRAEIVHLEREMNIRKQIFGVQVFNEIDFYAESSSLLQEQLQAYQQHQQAAAAAAAAPVNEPHDDDESWSPTAVQTAKPPPQRTDNDIFALLHRIKHDMDPIMARKRLKQEEIASLA